MTQIPCIDCITLPMCKALVKSHLESKVNKRFAFSALAFKCSLIKKYIDEECTHTLGSSRTREAKQAARRLLDFFDIQLITNESGIRVIR